MVDIGYYGLISTIIIAYSWVLIEKIFKDKPMVIKIEKKDGKWHVNDRPCNEWTFAEQEYFETFLRETKELLIVKK